MTDLDKELENAIRVVNNLSRDARAAGEANLMYAANRAWHQLTEARSLVKQNRQSAQKAASQLRQGEHRGD